ncbi:carbohydrate ABC transporter permease [Aestuariimicrobium ganziense]|uniref:carbohydrate ABC transporter permease n=1 Tax=Aestuariimicrobium ganziense TaxID=2773677 RepID=UPI001941EBE1|nr:sugar ABC transporter permease [Aestuariimicrobium ganziense]
MTVETVAPRPRSVRNLRLHGLLYLLPALLLVLGIVYAGIGYTGWTSFYQWDGLSPTKKFVGWGNYQRMLDDKVLWRALRHVGIFAVLTIFLQMAIGLGMAMLLRRGLVAGAAVYKAIMFIPVVMAPAVVATVFRDIMNPDGWMQSRMAENGLGALVHPWLADPKTALYGIVAINIWQWTGFSFVLYQAALAQVDEGLFEAASIDGASALQQLWYVLLPQLRTAHLTLIMTGCIGSLKTFDIVLLTTGGGPGRASEFLTTYIYKQAVVQFRAGYSAALSVLMLVVAVTITVIQMRLARLGED